MEKLEDRKRSFDINSLTKKEADQLSKDIGAKISQICDKACEDANRILAVYGMKTQMQFAVQGINEEVKPSKARRRHRKTTK